MREKCCERIYNGLKNEQNFFYEQKSFIVEIKIVPAKAIFECLSYYWR